MSTDTVSKLIIIMKKRTMPVRSWGDALNQFAVLYGERIPSFMKC